MLHMSKRLPLQVVVLHIMDAFLAGALSYNSQPDLRQPVDITSISPHALPDIEALVSLLCAVPCLRPQSAATDARFAGAAAAGLNQQHSAVSDLLMMKQSAIPQVLAALAALCGRSQQSQTHSERVAQPSASTVMRASSHVLHSDVRHLPYAEVPRAVRELVDFVADRLRLMLAEKRVRAMPAEDVVMSMEGAPTPRPA